MNDIIAGIVLYNPDITRLEENIVAVYPQVKKIIVFNNGSKNKESILNLVGQYKEKIVLISSSSNKGIAYALNQIAKEALNQGYKWLLTLDQDTIVTSNLIEVYSRYLNNPGLGQLCCGYEDKNLPGFSNGIDLQKSKNALTKVDKCIASGSVMNLFALKQVGGYDENLFIDEVDNEISYLLDKNGFSTYKVNFVGMNHEMGKIRKVSFLGKIIPISNYNSFRRFYITRNRIIVSHRFSKKEPKLDNFWSQLKDCTEILLFEKNKLKKIASIFKGIYQGEKDKYYKRKKYL